MSVVWDSTTLLLALEPTARPPLDPETDDPIDRADERVEHLIDTLDAAGEQIIIPTPVLAEVMVHAGDAADTWLKILTTRSVFKIVPFDLRAALEVAAALEDLKRRGGLRADAVSETVTRSKVKFDRQIVAIAKVEGAHTIYSDDGDLQRYGAKAGMKVVKTGGLPLPPEDPQGKLDV